MKNPNIHQEQRIVSMVVTVLSVVFTWISLRFRYIAGVAGITLYKRASKLWIRISQTLRTQIAIAIVTVSALFLG